MHHSTLLAHLGPCLLVTHLEICCPEPYLNNMTIDYLSHIDSIHNILTPRKSRKIATNWLTWLPLLPILCMTRQVNTAKHSAVLIRPEVENRLVMLAVADTRSRDAELCAADARSWCSGLWRMGRDKEGPGPTLSH